MRLLLITDTHCGCRNCHKLINEYFIKFYNEILFPYIEDNKIDAIVHLGDVFDSRQFINISILNQWNSQIFTRLNNYNIPMYIIVGNHDCYYNKCNYPNSVVELLSKYKNFHIIYDKPEVLDFDAKSLLVPWSYNDELFSKIIEESDATYCFGHFDIIGFDVIPGYTNTTKGFNIPLFKKFKQVFSGHYHNSWAKNNIKYLGTPYQITWNDYNNEKGFYLYDTKTNELEFNKNPFTLFEQICYNNNNIELPDLTNKFVKVIVQNNDNKILYNKFLADLGSFNTIENTIIFKNVLQNISYDASFDEISSTKDLINLYIDNNVSKINELYDNVSEVKDYILSLYNKANDIEM